SRSNKIPSAAIIPRSDSFSGELQSYYHIIPTPHSASTAGKKARSLCKERALFSLAFGVLSGLVQIAVKGVLGNAEIFTDLVAAFGDKERAGPVEELNGLYLVLLVHQRHRLAHRAHALLDQFVQQIGHIAG